MVYGLFIFWKAKRSMQWRSFRTQPRFYRRYTRAILGPMLFIIHFNDANKPLQSSRINVYHKNELIVSLNKGKTESMTFGTAKSLNRLQGRQLNLMINELHINSTTSYRYFDIHLDPLVNFETHFSKTCKKAAGRVNLLRKIRSSITCAAA